MPKKPSSWGIQEYVPQGNGDASGEYADDQGNNRHFVTFAQPLPKTFTTFRKTKPTNASGQTAKIPKTDNKAKNVESEVKAVLESGTIKQGNDNAILDYKRDTSKYAYGIEQALAQQGFDGLPQVVDADVFDEIVKKSKFVAQRGVGANDQETLDLYTDQLYNGKWYVSCDTGGAQYGMGMYCAADYTGTISSGVKAEAQDYADWNSTGAKRIETLTLTPDAKIVKHYDLIKDLNDRMQKDDKLYNYIFDRMVWGAIKGAEMYVDDQRDEIQQVRPDLWEYAQHELEYRLTGDVKRHKKLDKQTTYNMGQNHRDLKDYLIGYAGNFKDAIDGSANGKRNDYTVSNACEELGLNDGELAALLGYDAINAEGHGQSGSYTIILNRTKTIFKKQ